MSFSAYFVDENHEELVTGAQQGVAYLNDVSDGETRFEVLPILTRDNNSSEALEQGTLTI